MEPVIMQLLERYADSRPERPCERNQAVLALILVDQSAVGSNVDRTLGVCHSHTRVGQGSEFARALILKSFFIDDLNSVRQLVAKGRSHRISNVISAWNGRSRAGICCRIPPLWKKLLVRDAHRLLVGRDQVASRSYCSSRQLSISPFLKPLRVGYRASTARPEHARPLCLRDIVASVIAARAEKMIEWEDPEKAFADSEHTLPAGQYRIPLYRVAPDLRGFEMIVASSNNKAVENVSAALPNLKAIASDATPLRYFKTLADTLHQSETWGLGAAVLGTLKNGHRFKEVFWWHDT
jgi:hypothetical protein